MSPTKILLRESGVRDRPPPHRLPRIRGRLRWFRPARGRANCGRVPCGRGRRAGHQPPASAPAHKPREHLWALWASPRDGSFRIDCELVDYGEYRWECSTKDAGTTGVRNCLFGAPDNADVLPRPPTGG